MSDIGSTLGILGSPYLGCAPDYATTQHASWLDQNRAMQNAFKAPPAPRYPRIDPTKPMSDKAAHMLSINGFLKEA